MVSGIYNTGIIEIQRGQDRESGVIGGDLFKGMIYTRISNKITMQVHLTSLSEKS